MSVKQAQGCHPRQADSELKGYSFAALRQGDLGHHGQPRRRHRVAHPGEQTFPVSCLVAKRGGMVVFCAGTSGYNIIFDARYVWMRQKRIQGSHFAHLKQAPAANGWRSAPVTWT